MGSLQEVLLVVSILVFVSILISKLGYKFGIPTLLLFLVAGMLFGHDGVGIRFNDFHTAQDLGVIALCVILFSGALDTKINEIRPVLAQGLVLSTVGVLLTAVISGTFFYFVSNAITGQQSVSFVISLLLASTMSSTDSAAVFSTLRGQNVRLKYNLKPILELESGSNDPMAYVLTIVLIQVATTMDAAGVTTMALVGQAVQTFVLQFLVGGALGLLFGYGAVKVLNHLRLETTPLYAVLMLSIVFMTYTATSLLDGNGYLAIYIAGLIIGNKKIRGKKDIRGFFNGLTWLMQILMFLVLGLLVTPSQMFETSHIAGLLLGIFVMFVARPIAVMVGLLPFRGLNFKSRMFVSWVGLRGASPIIFATYPVVAGVHGAEDIFNTVFFITLLSLMLQGTTIAFAARRLDVQDDYVPQKSSFGIDIPEEVGRSFEIKLTEEALEEGNNLRDITLPEGSLVVMIKRGEEFLVPNGTLELLPGDILLMILQNDQV